MIFENVFFSKSDTWTFFIIPIYVIIAILTFYYYRKKLKRLFGDKLLSVLIEGQSYYLILLKKLILILALLFLIISINDPRWGEIQEKKVQINTDLILLVDVSSSMLVEDILPNRLEKVKLKINKIIKLQKGNRIGITIFAGSSFVYAPLTTDYDSLQKFVRNITTQMVSKQGTDLALGLETSLEAFLENDSQKVLVVFTDGENHNQDYKKIVDRFVKKDITVFMIGVGSPNGKKIPIRNEEGSIVKYLKDSSGNFVVSKLDYETLANITKKTRGIYFPLTIHQDDILAIDEFIKQNQLRYEERVVSESVKSRYQIFSVLAFLLLLGEMLIGTKKKSKPQS